MSLFVMCGQGIEPLLTQELAEIGFKETTPGFCGVYVNDSSMEAIYAINYRSRLASRVLLPLLEFRCPNQQALYSNCGSIDWRRYFGKGHTLAIDANVHHRLLRNSLFAAQVVKDAICDQLRETTGRRPTVDLKNPDVQLNLFIDKDRAVLSFDTSGQPLHKRGYRQDAGPAPLQETLAAALLKIASYNANEVTIDPCCGSGTLLIEAALMATHTAPGYLRKSWGFAAHPDFHAETWLRVKNEADSLRLPLKAGVLWGCEIDSEIARLCRANLRAAGFHREIEIFRIDFSEHMPKADYKFLITNPPHGKRLGSEENLRPLYRALGDFMKRKIAKPGRGFVFTSSVPLAKEVGLAAKRRHVISHGGNDARLLEFDLY